MCWPSFSCWRSFIASIVNPDRAFDRFDWSFFWFLNSMFSILNWVFVSNDDCTLSAYFWWLFSAASASIPKGDISERIIIMTCMSKKENNRNHLITWHWCVFSDTLYSFKPGASCWWYFLWKFERSNIAWYCTPEKILDDYRNVFDSVQISQQEAVTLYKYTRDQWKLCGMKNENKTHHRL